MRLTINLPKNLIEELVQSNPFLRDSYEKTIEHNKNILNFLNDIISESKKLSKQAKVYDDEAMIIYSKVIELDSLLKRTADMIPVNSEVEKLLNKLIIELDFQLIQSVAERLKEYLLEHYIN